MATLAGLAAFAFLVSLVMEWEGAPALSWISYASSRRKYSFLICMGTCGLLADSGLHALATCRHCLHQTSTRRAEDASRIAPPACTGWHECQPLDAAPEMCKEIYVPIRKETRPGVDLDSLPVQHHGCTAPPLSHSLEDFLQVHLLAVYLYGSVLPSSILSSVL